MNIKVQFTFYLTFFTSQFTKFTFFFLTIFWSELI